MLALTRSLLTRARRLPLRVVHEARSGRRPPAPEDAAGDDEAAETRQRLVETLFEAVANDDVDEAEEMIECGAGVDSADASGRTALMKACAAAFRYRFYLPPGAVRSRRTVCEGCGSRSEGSSVHVSCQLGASVSRTVVGYGACMFEAVSCGRRGPT